ncbi:hypothetical protein Q3V30_11690 [Erwinia pyri]|uniref:SIR2-like domain-containing protein n=1 Tax=Erwinia pyri TaxID=3062598 RepID=A0AA50HL75_9GAMM|nr:hypothetical protein [Erwinia sp. DE2]WLS77152.1 hypothetical protein Q3V30_11690 [Erwinia sp. DE2]
MITPKVSLIIGNGFSINFNYYHDLHKNFNTSSPIYWEVKCPTSKGLLIESFPMLKRFQYLHCDKLDFEVFNLILDLDACKKANLDQYKLLIEARHFLSLAFSHYSKAQRKKIKQSWPWFRWIKSHLNLITSISSFNYDLLIETMIKEMRFPFYSLPTQRPEKLLIVKPHGSCDYESAIPLLVGPKRGYPLIDLWADKNNLPLKRLRGGELIQVRDNPFCIVPTEHNIYYNFHAFSPLINKFHYDLSHSDYCIFIGISYMHADRVEIDEMLSCLPPQCLVVIANPSPSKDFINKIEQLSLKYVVWDNPNGPVNHSGDLLSLTS